MSDITLITTKQYLCLTERVCCVTGMEMEPVFTLESKQRQPQISHTYSYSACRGLYDQQGHIMGCEYTPENVPEEMSDTLDRMLARIEGGKQ